MNVFDRLLDAMKMKSDLDDADNFYDSDDEFYDEEGDFLDEESAPRQSFFERFSSKGSKSKDMDRDPDEAEEEDSFTDYEDIPEPQKASRSSKSSRFSRSSARERTRDAEPERGKGSSPKITPMRTSRRSSMSSSTMEVCVIRPNSMENTEEIADTLLENATVILNLEGINVDLAQRIFDFTSGCCYSLGGTLTKVSSYIFILGPSNVDVTGDLENIMSGTMASVSSGY